MKTFTYKCTFNSRDYKITRTTQQNNAVIIIIIIIILTNKHKTAGSQKS